MTIFYKHIKQEYWLKKWRLFHNIYFNIILTSYLISPYISH